MENIRKFSKSWKGRCAMVVILAPMAFLGMSAPSGSAQGDTVATVGSVDLLGVQLDNEVAKQRNSLARQGVDSKNIEESFLREKALDSLISDALLAQQAGKLGIGISDQSITELLKKHPDFQDENGKFSNEKFAQLMRMNDLSKDDLFAMERKRLVIQQLSNGILSTSIYPMADIEKMIDLEFETRNVWLHRADWQDFKAEVNVTDADIKSYFDENAAQFVSVPMVDLSYLKLNMEMIEPSDVDVSEDDIMQQYDAFLDENNYRDMREFSQILFTGDDAEARSKQAKQRLDDGEDFALVAQDMSDDDSGKNGGALGKFDPVMFGDDGDSMQKSLADLKANQVSEPLKNSFGYQIFKVTADTTDEVPTLASVRVALTAKALEYKRSVMFADKVTAVNELAANGFAIKDIADQEKLTISTLDNYQQKDNLSELAQPVIIQAAFNEFNIQDMSVAAGIEITEGDKTSMVWIQSTNYRPTRPLSLDETTDTIKQTLEQKKATELAVAFLDKKAEDIVTVDTMEKTGLTFTPLAKITRKNPSLTKNEQLIAFINKAEEGQVVASVTDTQSGASLIVADEITSSDSMVLQQAQKSLLANQIRDNSGQNHFLDYIEYLNAEIGVDIKEEDTSDDAL